MTTPPAPPAPPAPAPQPPAPPAPQPPAPQPPAPTDPQPPAPASDPAVARLEQTLADERRARKEAETALATLKTQGMSDADKAIAAARDEGRKEAEHAASLKLAAAEFRARAAGKIADPDAALDVLDLTKLLGKDGDPDTRAIDKLVGQLAAVPPPPGHVPPGVRDPAPNGSADFLRQAWKGGRR
jgi:hypothetical protein